MSATTSQQECMRENRSVGLHWRNTTRLFLASICKSVVSTKPDRCMVYGCSNTYDKYLGISIHKLAFFGDDKPEPKKRRKKWTEFTKRKKAKWTD